LSAYRTIRLSTCFNSGTTDWISDKFFYRGIYGEGCRSNEDGESKVLRNVDIPPYHCTASRPRRFNSGSYPSGTTHTYV